MTQENIKIEQTTEKVTVSFSPVCCGKKMLFDNNTQSFVHSINADINTWTCSECGNYIQVVNDQLDEEELENQESDEE